MVNIEARQKDYRYDSGWVILCEVEQGEVEQTLRHLRREWNKTKREGLGGRFEDWQYRVQRGS